MSKTTTPATVNKHYGSIEEGDDVDKSFDATQLQYLGEGKPLSREEKMRKVLRVGVPLLAAVLIVGAAVLLLLKDFGHLYPGRGGDHAVTTNSVKVSSSSHASTPAATTTTTTSSSSTSSSSSPLSSSNKLDPKCKAHESCADLDLEGFCCPTNDGYFLDCCN